MVSRFLKPPPIELVLFCVLIVNLLWPTSLNSLLNVDGDTAYHISLGRELMRSGALPSHDPLSFIETSGFIMPAWGSALIFFLVDRYFSLNAVAILCVMVFALTITFLFAALRQSSTGRVESIFLVAAAFFICRSHLAIRPHLFGWLMLVLLFRFISKIDRAELDRKGSVVIMFLLFTIWANLHGSFLFGLVLYTILNAARLFESGWRYAWLVAAAWLGSLCTPYGYELHLHIVRFMLRPSISIPIIEWSGPQISDPILVTTALLAGWAIYRLLRLDRIRSRFNWSNLIALAFLAVISFLAARMLPLAALSILGILSLGAAPSARTLASENGQRSILGDPICWAVMGALGATILFRVLGIQIGYDSKLFPVTISERLQSIPTRIFVDYNWSSYIAYRYGPGAQVFIHSGSDQSSPEALTEYMQALQDPEFALALIERYQIDAVLIAGQSVLIGRLNQREWQLYQDAQGVLAWRVPLKPVTP